MDYLVVGIDVSKQKLDVCLEISKSGKSQIKHYKFDNNYIGFQALLKILPENTLLVMENTGTYHSLCFFMQDRKIGFHVVNARVIKRFAAVNQRLKTDKADALMIRQYGIEKNLSPQKPINRTEITLKQCSVAVDNFQKSINIQSNLLESMKASGYLDNALKRAIESVIKHLELQLKKVEAKLSVLSQEHYSDAVALLETIPSIGKKTAEQILIHTGGLSRFTDPKHLIAFAGLDPSAKESGSSVHGQSCITKRGNKRLRKALYMASLSAKKCNISCKLLFDRLVANGKKKKQALIAVCNKLLRQALAIVKSKKAYDPKFA